MHGLPCNRGFGLPEGVQTRTLLQPWIDIHRRLSPGPIRIAPDLTHRASTGRMRVSENSCS